jgi:predicted metal-binding membrane protein
VVPTQARRGPLLCGPALVVATAWCLIGLAMITQHTYLLDHHQLMDGHAMAMAGHVMRMGGLQLPWYVALGIFLAAWQVMTAAMMLPASLPMVALFAQATQQQGRPRVAVFVFLAGYAAVWTAFALAAFLGDLLVSRASDAWPWLLDRPWVVGAATLAVAGVYECSSCKTQRLRACRSPLQFRTRCGPSGAGSAWRGGLHHGALCVGSCWALMLIMFGADLAAGPVMVALTAVMLAERAPRFGQQLPTVVGIALLLLAAVGLVYPAEIFVGG